MTAERFTVFGAGGFVGRRISFTLRASGVEVRDARRDDWPRPGEKLGHAIYAIGLTADFRTRPYDTVEAHVSLVSKCLERGGFDSFLYLSSTRIYRGAPATAEGTPLTLSPADPDRLYDLSKLCGEALCLSQANPAVRVARLSNVFGAGDGRRNFLGSVIAEAKAVGRVRLGQALDSAKDYVAVGDVCAALTAIARGGRERLYNVAAGVNTNHQQIAAVLTEKLGVAVDVAPGAPAVVNRPVDVTRLAGEIEWRPASVLDFLRATLASDRP